MNRNDSGVYDNDWRSGSYQRGASGSYSQDQASNQQNLPSQIRNKLRSQGFTDVRIAPGSYVVTAKDRDGDNVLMMIGPHSLTMIQGMSGSNDDDDDDSYSNDSSRNEPSRSWPGNRDR